MSISATNACQGKKKRAQANQHRQRPPFRVESCKRSRLRARPGGSVGVSQGEIVRTVVRTMMRR
jgi:hypothetical protein